VEHRKTGGKKTDEAMLHPCKTTISPAKIDDHHFYQELEDLVSYRMSENETILLNTKLTGQL
jgi:hypothetical protein